MESNHVIFAIIILAMAGAWWFLYHSTEADLAAARAAVKATIKKQQADLNSYIIRTDLHLAKLEQARLEQAKLEQRQQSHNQNSQGNGQLEATTNMVRAFHESIVFFQRKWQQQVEQLIADYPITLINPEETYLDQLLALPKGLADAESKLKAALLIAST